MLYQSAFVVAAACFRLITVADAQDTCYLPDGSIAQGDIPCLSNDAQSRCCAADEFCGSNNLCVNKNAPSGFTRGSCLDKQYGPSCPDFCQGVNDAGKANVVQCGDPSLGQFCCEEAGANDSYKCCETLSSRLTLGVMSTFLAQATSMGAMSKAQTTTTSSSSEQPSNPTAQVVAGPSPALAPAAAGVGGVAADDLDLFGHRTTTKTETVVSVSTAPARISETTIIVTSAISPPSPTAQPSSQAATPTSVSVTSPTTVSRSRSISTPIQSNPQTSQTSPSAEPAKSSNFQSSSTQLSTPTQTTAAAQSDIIGGAKVPIPPGSVIQRKSRGLSAAGIAGLVIGLSIAVGLILGAAYYAYLRRNSSRFSRHFERTLKSDGIIGAEKPSNSSNLLTKFNSKTSTNSSRSSMRSAKGSVRKISTPIKPPQVYMQPEEMIQAEFGAAMRSEKEIPYRPESREERQSEYRGTATTRPLTQPMLNPSTYQVPQPEDEQDGSLRPTSSPEGENRSASGPEGAAPTSTLKFF